MNKKEKIIYFILICVAVTFLSCVSTYATNYLYNSGDVSYDNTKTGLKSNNVQGAMEELYEHATDYSNIRAMIYPVGSIYLSVTDDTVEKVQERFGGTWQAFGQGRTIVGFSSSEAEFNAIEKTGGEKKHTLTVAEMPAHLHKQAFNWTNGGSASASGGEPWAITMTSGTGDGIGTWPYGTDSGASNFGSTGGSGAHNNLQPYITVYMYKRIS